MITIHIEFELAGAYNKHVINWIAGWLYREGYLFGFRYDNGELKIEIYAKRICKTVKPIDMFKFTFGEFIDDMYCFLNETKFGVYLAVCGSEGCIDIDWNDIKKLIEKEYEKVEKRLDEIISMIHGERP